MTTAVYHIDHATWWCSQGGVVELSKSKNGAGNEGLMLWISLRWPRMFDVELSAWTFIFFPQIVQVWWVLPSVK